MNVARYLARSDDGVDTSVHNVGAVHAPVCTDITNEDSQRRQVDSKSFREHLHHYRV